MHLAKQHLDVGLFSNRRDDQLAFWQQTVGLPYDHMGKVEGRDMQFRVLGCRGEWLQVINAEKGNVWIDRWCAKQEGCRG